MRRASLCLFFLVACGNGASQPPAASIAPPAEPAASSASAAPSADPEPPASRRKPFELKNSCSDVVTVVLGDDPKGKGRTLAPLASLDIPRNPEGHDVVWLLDAKSEPLVKVFVTRGMKRVEVGRSCRTLDAR